MKDFHVRLTDDQYKNDKELRSASESIDQMIRDYFYKKEHQTIEYQNLVFNITTAINSFSEQERITN